MHLAAATIGQQEQRAKGREASMQIGMARETLREKQAERRVWRTDRVDLKGLWRARRGINTELDPLVAALGAVLLNDVLGCKAQSEHA